MSGQGRMRGTVGRIGCVVIVGLLGSVAAEGAEAAERSASELAGQVEIRRTQYGVPHIEAADEKALAFGFAYCQAEDHLLSIMRLILRARGEEARHFGPAYIESDLRSHQFRVYARAVETYHKLDPDFRSLQEGFAAGLNYYIERHRDELPDWVGPVTPHDVVAHGMTGVMRFAFDRGGIIGQFKRQRLAGGERVDGATAIAASPADDGQSMDGSNMWALAPSRTTSGHAILLGNPHQAWATVSTYYEAHLKIPGKLNFYGSTFIGRPILSTGFNPNLAWTHTVNYPDLEEIYELGLDPDQPGHYLFDGGSVPIRMERVTVACQGRDSVTRTFAHTPLGPVIHGTGENIYVLRSSCYDEFRFYQQWYRMAQSGSFAEFRKVLDTRAIPMFNISYADREGNVFYLWNGSVPRMPHPNQFDQPVRAANSAGVWTEFHTIDELPQLFNPPGGYVQNCNAPPYFTNLQQPLPRENYPAHFPPLKLSLRTQHCLELIGNEKKFSLEDVRDMKFSMRMGLADRVKDDLLEAIESSGPGGDVRAAADLLRRWDNSVAAASRGGVLFETWWHRYAERVEQAGEEPYRVAWAAAEPMATPRGLSRRDLAVESFVWAVDQARREHGGWDVAWGDVHRMRAGSLDLPIGGGSGRLGCFRVLGFRQDGDGKRVARTGDSCVFAIEMSDPPRAYSVLAYSQSEVEASPHFNDQAKLFAGNQMKPVAFTDAEIERQLLKQYRPGEE